MPEKPKKSAPTTKDGRKPRTAREGFIMTRIEPDVAKDVRVERKRNGRTVQGEVNAVLRDHYASKWDAPQLVCLNQKATMKFAP